MARPKSTSPVIVSVQFTYQPSAIDAFNSADITLTSSTDQAIGLLQNLYTVNLNAPSLEAGVILSNVRCDAFGTLKFRLTNTTGTSVSPASQVWNLIQR